MSIIYYIKSSGPVSKQMGKNCYNGTFGDKISARPYLIIVKPHIINTHLHAILMCSIPYRFTEFTIYSILLYLITWKKVK